MSDAGTVTVQGEARLAATLAIAAQRVRDFTEANGEVARYLAARSRARAPRRSGRLAASGRGTGESGAALVEYLAPYAGVIHYGWPARHIGARPWAVGTVESSQPAVVGMYQGHLEQVLDGVKGV